MISFNVPCHHPTIQSSTLSQESNTPSTTHNDPNKSKRSRTYTVLPMTLFPITLFQESNQSRKHSIFTKINANTNTCSSLNHPLVAEFTTKNIISRRLLLLSTCVIISPATFFPFSAASNPSNTTTTTSDAIAKFYELPNSGGVKALDLRPGTGSTPIDGDQVAIHYYGRLAAKQGWRFDSTYDHKDSTGEPIPFTFILGSNNVISGIETAVRSMKEGGIRRVIIPPSQGYQTTTQEPLPPNYFDRQRLFTTIFNPTRLANGEGSTLGTLIFDIELVKVRHFKREARKKVLVSCN